MLVKSLGKQLFFSLGKMKTRLLKGFLTVLMIHAAAVTTVVRAKAESLADRRTWISIEGGLNFLAGNKQDWAEVGTGDPISNVEILPDDGIRGGLGIVTPLADTQFDLGVSLRGDAAQANDSVTAIGQVNTLSGQGLFTWDTAIADHRETNGLVDIDLRKNTLSENAYGHMALTWKFGVRLAYFQADTDVRYSSGALVFEEKRTSRYLGIGPRIGLAGTVPVSDGVYLEWGADASLLFGDQKRSYRFSPNGAASAAGHNAGTTSRHTFRIVPTLGTSLALSFLPELLRGGKVSVGVRADARFGAFDQSTKLSWARMREEKGMDGDRFSVSPFVRLVFPFGT